MEKIFLTKNFKPLLEKLKNFPKNNALSLKKAELEINEIDIKCPFCRFRHYLKLQLDKLDDRDRERHRTTLKNVDGQTIDFGVVELYEQYGECPKCHSLLGSVIADFERAKHQHSCFKCGWQSKEYQGRWEDDNFTKCWKK